MMGWPEPQNATERVLARMIAPRLKTPFGRRMGNKHRRRLVRFEGWRCRVVYESAHLTRYGRRLNRLMRLRRRLHPA